MHIALVCSDRSPCPPVKGGAIQLLISKVAPILAKKHHVTVYSIKDPELKNEERVDGVKYIRYDQNNFISKVCRDISTKKMDIIQLYNRPGWILKVRKASPRSKIVLSLHNLVYTTLSIEKNEAEANMKELDHLITVSNFVKNDTVSKFPNLDNNGRAIYTGVDLNEFASRGSNKGKRWRKEIRKKYNISEKDNVLLYVGRLVSYKGCHLLIKALKKVVKKHPHTKLLVVGSKWYADNTKDKYLEKLYRLANEVKGHVIFTKYVPVDEIAKYYAAADIFVCTSQWKEPLARVHYEAMAAGLPIITTKRGGNHEVMNHNTGIVIKDYKNKEKFSESIMRLLDNPKKAKRMGQKGRELTKKTYNFSRVAQDYEKTYQLLINSRNKKKRKKKK